MHNKTATWLENKTIEEKKRFLHAARTLTPVHRASFCKRRKDIELKRRSSTKKERKRVRKKEKEIKEKEELTKKISFVRIKLWTTKHKALASLDKIIGKKAKKDALKLQISFHKKVLGQTSGNQTLFQFSHNAKFLQTLNYCKIFVSYC